MTQDKAALVELVGKLTEAEREIILCAPQMMHAPAFIFTPPGGYIESRHVAAFARRHSELFQKQRGRFSLEYRLSPLGLALREHLLANQEPSQ